MNEQIRLSPILLIDENNQRIGEVPTHEALTRARELGLDLVEIDANTRPIVCKIMDYGKHKYEQSKKDKASRARSKVTEMKEVRMGRSMKIDPHDVAIRLKQAREFLLEGHKVMIVQNFRGREMQHRDRGDVRMKEIAQALTDIAKVEVPPRLFGKRMSMILSPDRVKIEQLKRREEKDKKAGGSATPAATGAAPAPSEPSRPPAAPSPAAAPSTARPRQEPVSSTTH
jgi:translation initiation factor IF-3